jgi:hypothetical protein
MKFNMWIPLIFDIFESTVVFSEKEIFYVSLRG